MQKPIITRRNFLFGSGAAASIAALAGLIEPKWLRVSEHDVPIAKLPKALDGYRIAHITDAHLRNISTVEKAIIQEIISRDIPLVVLTGDIIDNSSPIPVLEEFCRNLDGNRRTILAALGNWEHLCHLPINALRSKYQAHKIRLLINESLLIDSAISVAATDDLTRGNVLLSRTMKDRTVAAANLFFTHSPKLLDQIPATIGRFDLALAGHTHGGQCRIGSFAPVRPPGSGRFVSGWYKIPIGKAYVSCGTGTSSIPIRIFCRPELPIFTLRQG
jgi:predicted MPP superfamily phosphohydrolase